MLEVLKEEMSRLIKEIYENIDSKRKWRKQIKTCKWKKINKESETEEKLKLRYLGTQIGTSERQTSLTECKRWKGISL